VGNLGICLGLMLIAHNIWVYAVGLGFFFGEYFFIIRAEEAFLRQQFGQKYEEYQQRVSRWIPRLRPAYSGSLASRFDVSRALKKEHNPFAAWASAALLLLGRELYVRGELTDARQWTLITGGVLVLTTFGAIKAYKRGWLV
jgi:hypothetical protein